MDCLCLQSIKNLLCVKLCMCVSVCDKFILLSATWHLERKTIGFETEEEFRRGE